jgi:hypothetical protein
MNIEYVLCMYVCMYDDDNMKNVKSVLLNSTLQTVHTCSTNIFTPTNNFNGEINVFETEL